MRNLTHSNRDMSVDALHHSVSLPQATAKPLASSRREQRVESAALAARLRSRVRGEVRFDDGSRALYATDSSNYRQVPIGVVIPKDTEDVIATIATAREFGAPILARGGGTTLPGQSCNVAVVMDLSKYMNRIPALHP